MTRKPKLPSGRTRISFADGRADAVAAGVGDDHDLELEPLRRVDRQQAHRVGSLLLRDGLELGRADSLLVANHVDEALDVRPAQLLVGAREAHQLAQVRVAALPVPACEHREVVVVRSDDLLAEPLEARARRRGDEPLVPLLERAHEPFVIRRERLGQRALDPRVERTPAGMAADQDDRVVRDADERRQQHRRERLVVVAVVQQPEIREQVDDLLLAEVPAAGRAVRRQPLCAQRRLVPLCVGSGCEQQHDLATGGRAGVDELADSPRDRARLAVAPARAGALVALLVADLQLDRVAEHRVGELARRSQRLVVVCRTPRRTGG